MPVLVALAFSLANAQPDPGPVAVRAWFTDAAIDSSVQVEALSPCLEEADGTNGSGVRLSAAVPVENPLFDARRGLISFWLRPQWNGGDGRGHRIVRLGEPGRNGLVVEKAASGMLRYVMAAPTKTTVARADVSHWRAGEWHHIAIGWFSANGRAVGLPLWIDRVAVDGPIFGAAEFAQPADTRVWIGDESAEADMDELIMRADLGAEGHGQLGTVYRDWFRTAPFDRVAIDLHPHYGPMDPRVVCGYPKQFGLLARRHGRFEKVTDFAVRYLQWSYFDAKPFIRWHTSDEDIATVDANGRVTGRALGECTLTAEFRGMKARQRLQVIPVEQPDLDLVYVERLPRYSSEADKDRPAPGDHVQSVARVINFGYVTAPTGAEVRLELIPDANRNFRRDEDERPVAVQRKTMGRPLAPREEVRVRFDWTWTDQPTWVRVTVDPAGTCREICEANNERCELNIARPLAMGVEEAQMESIYRERQINHIGSFSEFDWVNGQLARFEAMMRDAVYPTTSSAGVGDAFRVDQTYTTGKPGVQWDDEPLVRDAALFDGGFPVREPIDLMAIDAAILHEYGHTCAALPDLYGYGVEKQNVFLHDANGEPYAGGDLMPCIRDGSGTLPLSSATTVPCGVSYPPLMDLCSLWLAPFEAGQIHWFAGYRGPRFWAVQDELIPQFDVYLKVLDVDDRPLRGAAVYVYPAINTMAFDASGKYFADLPKFVGHTDQDGRYRFPHQTDAGWDDPDTDTVDGSIYVEHPFARVQRDINFTPNVWTVEGLLLLRIVAGEQTEFAWLPLTELNRLFFAGSRAAGTVVVRTSLVSLAGETPLVEPAPAEARSTNLRPTAAVSHETLTVKCGEAIRIDGSASSDPEGKPLTYCWVRQEGGLKPERAWSAAFEVTAPDEPGESVYAFYVIDGLRCSEPVSVHIRVTK